jgi:ribosomal protein L7Ae-like RNA K-turn-binding protein
MKRKAILNLIGLAGRARFTVSGSEQVINSIRNQEIKLVIIATDASEATKKLLSDKCNFYQIDYIYFASADELGNSIGKEHRIAIGIKDAGIAKKIKDVFNNLEVI